MLAKSIWKSLKQNSTQELLLNLWIRYPRNSFRYRNYRMFYRITCTALHLLQTCLLSTVKQRNDSISWSNEISYLMTLSLIRPFHLKKSLRLSCLLLFVCCLRLAELLQLLRVHYSIYLLFLYVINYLIE